MYLTVDEQRNFKDQEIRQKIIKPLKKKFKPKFVCPLGHELFPLYYRNHHIIICKRIDNNFYCLECKQHFTVNKGKLEK